MEPSMTASELAPLVHGRAAANGWWSGKCPAHDDHSPSLSFRDGDRALIVKCWRGCTREQIAAGINVPVSELLHGDPLKDARGQIVAVHCRRLESNGQKRVWWDGGLNGRPVANLPLYGIDEMPDSGTVLVVEGEPARDALARHGVAAVATVTGAATIPSDDVLRPLLGLSVILWPDADNAGIAHMRAFAAALRRLGHEDVRVLAWPGARPGSGADAVNFFACGQTVERLRELIGAAKPPSDPSPTGWRFTRVAELIGEATSPRVWLVGELIEQGSLVVVAGRPKTGKTTLCRVLAAAVARGMAFLGRQTAAGPVLYCSLEDSRRAVGEHFGRLGISESEPLYVHAGAAPPEALTTLRGEVERLRPALVVVDTVFRLSHVRDVAAYAEVNAALTPLLALARELAVTVVLVHHSPKGSDGRDAADAPLGSVSISGTADVLFHLRRRGDQRTLAAGYRAGSGEDLAETVVELDAAAGTVRLGPSRREHEEQEAAALILEFLSGQAEPVEEPAIMDAVEGRQAVKRRALRGLVEQGAVIRRGKGRKGDPFCYADADSKFSYPHIPGYENTRIEKPGLSADGSDGNSRTGFGADFDSRTREENDLFGGRA